MELKNNNKNTNQCEYCNIKTHKSSYCPNKKKILSKRNYNVFSIGQPNNQIIIINKKNKKNKNKPSPLCYSSDEEE